MRLAFEGIVGILNMQIAKCSLIFEIVMHEDFRESFLLAFANLKLIVSACGDPSDERFAHEETHLD